MSALASGELVAGRYRIEAPLGSGGMGVVYRATQLPMERAVALKVLRRDLSELPHARARFEREARVASALDHPARVAVYDAGEHEGLLYLAMELVLGESLRAVLERGLPHGGQARGGLGVARAMDLARQLADVLAAAHGAGLVHRDLKPENVMIEPASTSEREGEGRARVLDFGLAFLAVAGPAGRMTREGVVVGTPDYLSPEQARGEDVGPATDVYALGCVLHEVLTGRPPFDGAEIEVLSRQMFAPPPPLMRPDGVAIPAALDALYRAMLEKQAARRPSAAEVRDRLALLDPDPLRARARAPVDGYLGPRAGRMVDAAPDGEHVSVSTREVAIFGEASPELLLGLSANGIAAFIASADERPSASTVAIYAPAASLEEITALKREGKPIVTDAPRGDVRRLSALLKAGAADVVLQPVTAAELARKLARVSR